MQEKENKGRMKAINLRQSFWAHIYLNLAAGRLAQILWEIKKQFGRIKKGRKKSAREKELVLWLHRQELEKVEIKSREGIKLTGRFLKHTDAERVVLMFHGWRGRWDQDGAALAKGLYEKKSSILLVNQRAHQTSGGKYIGFGVLERYDCLKWLEYLVQNTNPSLPIYLSGISMGAATVLMTSGLELPERVAGVIADCGFTTPYEMIRIFAKKFFKSKEIEMADAVNCLCKKKAGYDLKEYSTLEAMKSCSVPVFFAHGTKDMFVPYEMTVQNYEACVSKKKLLSVEGAVHTGSYLSDPQKYMDELAEFFQWD